MLCSDKRTESESEICQTTMTETEYQSALSYHMQPSFSCEASAQLE